VKLVLQVLLVQAELVVQAVQQVHQEQVVALVHQAQVEHQVHQLITLVLLKNVLIYHYQYAQQYFFIGKIMITIQTI
jgi:hypothetical protein